MAFSGRMATVLAAILAIGAGSVYDRERVVRLAPRSAAVFAKVGLPVNLDRLDFGIVRATIQSEGPRRALVVETEISNPHGESRVVPPLRLSVRDDQGNLLYTWTTNAGVKMIPGGTRIPVRARLASPPAGSDVAIEFAPSASS